MSASSAEISTSPQRAARTASPAAAEPIVSTLPRRQLGRYLRDWRTRAGLTIAEAARLMEWGASTLQRLEKGQADRIRTLDIGELCRIYGIPDDLAEGLKGLARQPVTASWWHEHDELVPVEFDVYLGLEVFARSLNAYRSEVVLGLLQTAEYARALNQASHPRDSEARAERRVQTRIQRQASITRRAAPATLEVILHEAVLRRVVGGARVMAGQLRHLADMSTRANVSLRVLPFGAGAPLGVSAGSFTVLDFGADAKGRPVEPPVVHVPGLSGDLYLERGSDVRRYDRAHECLLGHALDAQSSRQLLRRAAKEYAA